LRKIGDGGWGLGVGGLGIGDWAQSPIPNPQSPIPNPHLKLFLINYLRKNNKNKINYIVFNYLFSKIIKN